ncbi:uncharacterized protein KY384_001335 [Bacidia gigantensis]|uniref:uncharacterized protein n=1 Tax=Bacidia gigantensis TaxID=2732470 RepID=UPI001D03B3C7|nr:uncharacterized protein KY384_001335 [Bacidia gigantensis]KAG8533595.1 hypothetical protein KY384_001335 [Bacidia gigantensis]
MSKCPFSPGSAEPGALPPGHPTAQVNPSTSSQNTAQKATDAHSQDPVPKSRSLSMNDSIAKCPIRLLDERSPEEIANFFETHKHEVPRSHEICVRRYQSNEQSIRSLDAKYGDLVNMVKGLGLKHQSMLPPKDDDQSSATPKSNPAVEEWATIISAGPKTEHNLEEVQEEGSQDARVGHFDRPLRDIRVGESPSRPWGIHVPDQHHPVTDDAPRRHSQTNSKQPTPAEMPQIDPQLRSHSKASTPQMLFTGPVFIGYPPEQIATILAQFPNANHGGPT